MAEEFDNEQQSIMREQEQIIQENERLTGCVAAQEEEIRTQSEVLYATRRRILGLNLKAARLRRQIENKLVQTMWVKDFSPSLCFVTNSLPSYVGSGSRFELTTLSRRREVALRFMSGFDRCWPVEVARRPC